MEILIKDGAVITDPFTLIDNTVDVLPDYPAIIPLDALEEIQFPIAELPSPLGVWVNGDTDPALLNEHLPYLSVIAVNFPNFADGRGYSLARILRDELGFTGELRAFGEVLIDQLYYLRRCGFDSFVMPKSTDTAQALNALGTFKHAYQAATVDDQAPLLERY